MTRAETIKWLSNLKKDIGKTQHQELWHYEQAIDEIIKTLEQEPKWIPCSERMPEEREWIGTEKFGTTISDKVLVTFESRGERFVKPMKFQNGELGGMDKHTMDAFFDEWKAVAWMPLPEAYREDGEEE